MSQDEIDRAVSVHTGESIRTIRRRGFSLVNPLKVFDPDEEVSQPRVVDWDELQAARSRAA